eukprot:c57322_g1_i1 orf=188-364(+)
MKILLVEAISAPDITGDASLVRNGNRDPAPFLVIASGNVIWCSQPWWDVFPGSYVIWW